MVIFIHHKHLIFVILNSFDDNTIPTGVLRLSKIYSLRSMQNLKLHFYVKFASHILVFALLAICLFGNLLPGVLGVCLGYLFNSSMIKHWPDKKKKVGSLLSTVIVIALPLLILSSLLFHVKDFAMSAINQYKELLLLLAQTVLDLKQKLPAEVGAHLPTDTTAIQLWLANWIKSQAHTIAHAGQVGAGGTLRVYIGMVIGALITVRTIKADPGILAFELGTRAKLFLNAFRQVIAAQFWIATFNATLTGIFLGVIMPMTGVDMPYVPALIALTFFAGLIPIAGNLLCNTVIALVGISVSPLVGLSCLLFLIAIHKVEYFLNAKFIGKSTQTAAWELLAVMFAFEALFGVTGLVASPLFYAYLKSELKESGLIK